MKQNLIIFNWKAYPNIIETAINLSKLTENELKQNNKIISKVIICPPFPYLAKICDFIKLAKLGSQDISSLDLGAFTGEVPAKILKGLKVEYSIIGHSERRILLAENSNIILRKFEAALREKITPILCVGENLKTRETGILKAKKFVSQELDEVFKKINIKLPKKIIIAYEPIWAIGTGKPDTVEEIGIMASFIKEYFLKYIKSDIKIIYGGSVNSKNITSILNCPYIEGCLIGGASLKRDEIIKIIRLLP